MIFKKKSISSILTVLPGKIVKFDDEISNYSFSENKTAKLKKIMGYNQRHVVEDDTAGSDLALHGLRYLLDEKIIADIEIGALVVVTQSPDFILPPTSNVIHGKLKLGQDVLCMDINQGCAGYIVGLMQSFMLLDVIKKAKVVLITVDVLSKKVSKRDRNSNPIVGDGAAITIIEKIEGEQVINFEINMDGTGWDVLQIPAGGFRLPSSDLTRVMQEDQSGNIRSLDNLVMRGDDVFNFVQTRVPPMIESLLKVSGYTKNEIDYFVFHQPNKFMLNKLADKLEVPRDKVPSNVVENFGNASSVTIPTAIAFNYSEELRSGSLLLCLAGFGVGLTWAGLVMEIGKLDICKIIYY
jgi:3-oxoacyl-[acyl-carrier-protein] synthase III